MKYNKLVEEEKQLEAIVTDLRLLKEKLIISAGSAERLSYILSNYEEYQRIMNSEPESELASQLAELEIKKRELQDLLNNSENKEYIVEIAREQLGLYFPDEEIYYSNIK
jgi:cell division protein FtsB